MVRLGEIVVIHDLKRQGLSVSAIARQVGLDRKTVRKYLDRGLEAPVYGPRMPRERVLAPYETYLRARVTEFPGLSGVRLLREIRDRGYEGGYTAVTDYLREARPPRQAAFERRFETPPGGQAQVDFAEFATEFTDEPGVLRKVWLFSLVLGHSCWLWGRFAASQNLQTVLRCHVAAFDAMQGAPAEILYDRMKTAVVGEDAEGTVSYNRSLVALLDHYAAAPRACQPYRAKTKGKVERPFRYIRQDFFLGPADARTLRLCRPLTLGHREQLALGPRRHFRRVRCQKPHRKPRNPQAPNPQSAPNRPTKASNLPKTQTSQMVRCIRKIYHCSNAIALRL